MPPDDDNIEQDENEQIPQQKRWYTFLFSTIALVIGWLSLISYITQTANGVSLPHGHTFSGFYMLLGTTAYRSAKRRRLQIKRVTKIRYASEIILVLFVIITPFIFFRPHQIVTNPAIPIGIPVWVLIAYLIETARSWRSKN